DTVRPRSSAIPVPRFGPSFCPLAYLPPRVCGSSYVLRFPHLPTARHLFHSPNSPPASIPWQKFCPYTGTSCARGKNPRNFRSSYAAQASGANFPAARISSIVTLPLLSASAAVHALTGKEPSAMFTAVRISSTVTELLALQSPVQLPPGAKFSAASVK